MGNYNGSFFIILFYFGLFLERNKGFLQRNKGFGIGGIYGNKRCYLRVISL